MKKLYVSSAILGLTALLTACGGGDTPAMTHSLTVKLEGVPAAPVTVTNTSTNTQVFSGTLEGSKTFADLKAGAVFKVEGGAVNGQTSPTAQTVTLNGDKTVTLNYTALPGVALDPARVRGTLSGWAFGTGKLTVDFPRGSRTVDATTPTITPSASVDSGLPTPQTLTPFLEGCTFTGEPKSGGFNTEFAFLGASTPQGDYLGNVAEQTPSGDRVLRIYSDTAAQLKGTAICYGSERLDLDMRVTPGWNALNLSEVKSEDYRGDYRLRNIEAGTHTTLKFLQAEPKVFVELKPTTLTFTNDDAVTAEASFTSSGGASGTFKLRTDDPDLTVEPDTVTLPVLGAQSTRRGLGTLSLTGQSVTTSLKFRYKGADNGYKSFLLEVLDGNGQRVGVIGGTLEVRRPGISIIAPFTRQQVTPHSSVKFPVSLYSMGGFSGSVTVRMEDLPAGITSDSSTVTLGSSTSTELALTGGAAITPGEYTATLVAEGGGHRARTNVQIVVPKPSVSVRVNTPDYSGIGLYRGSSSGLSVSVTSNAGFNGDTTLTVTGLPAGLSASPVTLRVTSGMTTTARIPLTVAADAPLGTFTLQVTSPDSDSSAGGNSATVSVLPARAAFVPTYSLAATNEGVWGLYSRYDSATYRTINTLVLSDGQNNIRDITLPAEFGSEARVVSGPDGTLWVYGSSYPSRVSVIPAGSNSVTTFSLGNEGIDLLVVDAQGRAYAAQRVAGSTNARTLKRITLSGEISTVAGINPQGLTTDVTGKTVFTVSNQQLSRIDTATGTVTSQELPSGSFSQIAVTVDGTVWLRDYNGLARVNADGTLSTVTLNGTASGLLLADRTRNLLYVGGGYSSYPSVTQFDTATNQQTVVQVKESGGFSSEIVLSPARNGGLWATYRDIQDPSGSGTVIGYITRLF